MPQRFLRPEHQPAFLVRDICLGFACLSDSSSKVQSEEYRSCQGRGDIVSGGSSILVSKRNDNRPVAPHVNPAFSRRLSDLPSASYMTSTPVEPVCALGEVPRRRTQQT